MLVSVLSLWEFVENEEKALFSVQESDCQKPSHRLGMRGAGPNYNSALEHYRVRCGRFTYIRK